MKDSEVLKACKAHLKGNGGHQVYICNAIRELEIARDMGEVFYDAREWVMDRIAPEKRLIDHLAETTNPECSSMLVIAAEYFVLRDEWLDALIAELEAKGE